MSEAGRSELGVASVLYRRGLRFPIPDEAAERAFHENMSDLADVIDEKARRIGDPNTRVIEAYQYQLDAITERYEETLRVYAGEDYASVAREYVAGERDDGVGALATYLLEVLWRLQQLFTVTEQTFMPVVLRYPESVVVNARFTGAHVTDGVLYESPGHVADDLPPDVIETYHAESRYSQREAAEHIAANAALLREEFPDPRETTFAERRTGGVAAAFGRRGSEFSSARMRLDPNPDRFDDVPDGPELVAESEPARRTASQWLPDDATVI